MDGAPEPGELAEAVANGGGWLLTSFATVVAGSSGVVDLDVTRHDAHAWVVGTDAFGCLESRVRLERDADGRWKATDTTSSTWDGWPELAMERPPRSWPDAAGPVLGLTCDVGRGSGASPPVAAVRGVAAREVVAVQLSCGGEMRRRTIDSPTGGFLVAVAASSPEGPRLRVLFRDGTAVSLPL